MLGVHETSLQVSREVLASSTNSGRCRLVLRIVSAVLRLYGLKLEAASLFRMLPHGRGGRMRARVHSVRPGAHRDSPETSVKFLDGA